MLLFHKILGSLSTRMSEGRRLESSSFARGKSARLYCQTFHWIAGLGRGPLRETEARMVRCMVAGSNGRNCCTVTGAIGKHKINGCLRYVSCTSGASRSDSEGELISNRTQLVIKRVLS